MRNFIRPMIVSISLCACAGTSYAWPLPNDAEQVARLRAFAEKRRQSVLFLSYEKENVDKKHACTALKFAEDKKARTDYYLTAAHCVLEPDGKTLTARRWYLHADTRRTQVYMSPRLIAVGEESKRRDFAVFALSFDDMLGPSPPPLPLCEKPKGVLEPVLGFSAIAGYAIEVFGGHVTAERLNRSVDAGLAKWDDALLVQLTSEGGASGGPVVSLEQECVVGIHVGRLRPGIGVVLPIDWFHAFWRDVQRGAHTSMVELPIEGN